MAKRVAVQLVADGNPFVEATEKTLRTMRQQFSTAGRQIDAEFSGIFKNGAREAERAVRAAEGQIQNLAKSASMTGGGLRFDRSGLDAELASARQYLAIQQQISVALDRVAEEEGQAGAAARVRAEAQRIAIGQSEERVRGIEQEIALLNRLQGELGETAQQQRRVTAVNGEARAGMQQLSFQVADIASGFASGIPPMQIFAQQSTQVVQAVQMMSAKTTGLIGFLGGPWGLVITAAATVLGTLVMKLWDAEEASKAAELASNGLGDAQSVLGQMFDLTTGKIKSQNDMLILNARIMVANLRAQAAKAKAEGSAALDVAISSPVMGYSGALQRMVNREGFNAKRFEREKLADVANRVKIGVLSPGAAAKELRGIDFSRAGISEADFLQGLANQSTAREMPGIADALERSIDSGKLDPSLRQAGASRRGRKEAKGPDPAKAAEAMANKLGEAYEKAVQLRGQFDEMPSDIDRANNALIDAQQLIAQAQKTLADPKATEANRKRAQDVLRVATEAKALAEAAPSKPFADNLDAMREQIDAQRLLIDGRTAEYHTMQDMAELARQLGADSIAQIPALLEQRKIGQDRVDQFMQQRDLLRLQTYEIQRQQAEEQKLLGFVEDRENVARQTIYDILSGKGVDAFKDTIRSLGEIARREMTEQVFKAVFGDHFEKQKLKILGLDKVDASGNRLASSIDKTVPPIRELGDAAAAAARKLRGAANDNSLPGTASQSPKSLAKFAGADSWPLGDIIVSAPSPKGDNAISELKKLTKVTKEGLADGGSLTKGLGSIGKTVSKAMQGAAYGEAASGVLRSLGVKQSKLGSQIGGGIGGAFFGPIGGIVGGLIGGTIGGLLKKTPRGYATIGGNAGSPLSITGTGGNSKSAREAGMGAAGEVITSIESIAEALGGTYDASRGSVSIGRSGDSWHVDTTGKGRLKKSQGGQDFNDDYEAAVRAATMDLIKDGVITGISAAAQRVLQAGGDLQKAIEKASLIESIPKLLKARTNPVAAALDELNDKWAKTVAVLKEGAATAEQFADAEKLYQMERDDIMKAANDNLKEFINGLNFGPNSGLSLRDQSAAARANVQPYLDAIAKGDIGGIDREKYLAAADSYLQLSRALNGSGSGYFANVDELRKATQSLLDQSESQSKAAEARDPFAEATAQNTKDAANILSDQTELLKRIEAGIAALGGGAPFDFIGTARNFVNRSAA